MMKTRFSYVGKQFLWILLILALAALIFALGLAFGYGGLGQGDNPWRILSLDAWKALFAKLTGS